MAWLANKGLRERLATEIRCQGYHPNLRLCGDNAGMIAYAKKEGMEQRKLAGLDPRQTKSRLWYHGIKSQLEAGFLLKYL